MNKTEKIIASTGLAIGAVFGVSGSIFTEPAILQHVLYEISSLGLITATVLLAVKFVREKNDLLATGFLLFAIGEAVVTVGIPLGAIEGQHAFGAGIALYVPGLLFLSIPKGFPVWVRIAGVAASIPFAIAAAKIFLGEHVPFTATLPGIGYGLLVITIIGWISTILRKQSQ